MLLVAVILLSDIIMVCLLFLSKLLSSFIQASVVILVNIIHSAYFTAERRL